MKNLHNSNKPSTFAPVLETRGDGRVVDCGGLENRCTFGYRGFESLSLRKSLLKEISEGFFLFPYLYISFIFIHYP